MEYPVTRPSSNLRLDYSTADAKKLLRGLLGIEVFFALAYLFTRLLAPDPPLGPLRGFFNVDQEVSIPTWFSSVQLFVTSVVILTLAGRSPDLRIFLIVLGCAFLFLSMDEAAAVHDSLFKIAQKARISWLAGAEYLAWMVPYAAVGIIGLLLGRRPALLLWRRYPHETALVGLGGALFIGGGIGIEIATHFLYKIAIDANFHLAVAAEEFCEMAGVSVVLYGFLLLGNRLRAAGEHPAPATPA